VLWERTEFTPPAIATVTIPGNSTAMFVTEDYPSPSGTDYPMQASGDTPGGRDVPDDPVMMPKRSRASFPENLTF
jgi:hypothetical protein